MESHWITEGYQRFWEDGTRFKKVWIMELDTGKISNSSPRSIATVTNLYHLENTDGTLNSVLEDQIAAIEDKFIKVVRRKILKEKPLSEEDKVVVAAFLSLWIHRRPDHLQSLTEFTNKILNDWVKPHIFEQMHKKAQTKQGLDEYRKMHVEEFGVDIPLNDQDLRQNLLEYKPNHVEVEVTKNRMLNSTFNININEWVYRLLNMPWLVVKGDCFVTGDFHLFRAFPLTPQYCLMLADPPREYQWYEKVDFEQGNHINKLVKSRAVSFVIANNRERLEGLI